jgi:hypothetical protein
MVWKYFNQRLLLKFSYNLLHICRLSTLWLLFFSFKWFNWFCFRRIYFFRKGSKKDGNLSIFLEAARMKIVIVSKRCSNNVSKGCLSKEWSRDVKFKLVVFNQLDTNRTITKGNCFFPSPQ